MEAKIQASFIQSTFRSVFRVAFGKLLAATVALSLSPLAMPAFAQSAPAVVPVPFNTALVGDGVAPSAASACTNSIENTNGSTYGDGCTAAGGLLSSPQGVGLDKYGNVYISDYSDRLVRVVYYGGASVAAAITAANSGYTISATRNAPAVVPVVGNIYTIAGFGGSTTAALTATATDGNYECANYATTGQPEANDSLGDGCPAASAVIGPRDVTADNDGNLFLTDYTNSRIRVLCINCASTTLAAKLITLENPGVTPVNGAMYTVAGYSTGYRDGPGYGGATSSTSTVALFRSPTQAVVSSAEDVFIADNLDNAVRVLYNGGAVANAILAAEGYTGATAPVVGNVYTIVGDGCTPAPSTTSGAATTYECIVVKPGSGYTAETISLGNGQATGVVWSVYLDANGNVFYTSDPDSTNDRVKVLYGGVAPPLSFPNATYPTLKVGDVYTFAGSGTGAAGSEDGVAPGAITLSSAQSVSGDTNGNIFFVDYGTGLFYETYAQNGLTAIIGGGGAITTTPGSNAYCNGGTSGPQMVDAYYDGCPLTQAKLTSVRGPVVADSSGNLYFGDSVGYFVRKFNYNPTFPTTATGARSAAQPYAFTFLSAQTIVAPTLLVNGDANGDYVDAGGDTCTAGLSATAGDPGTTCVVNVAFMPTGFGASDGAVELSSATGVLGSTLFSGAATGAALNIDPGTSTTTGTGLVPEGIAVGGAGRVYVSDNTSKSVLLYFGPNPTTIATGFTAPTGVAVDGVGDVFVADSNANTITEVPVTGTKFTLTTAVSSPHGLTTDGLGRLYVADTGNNRVLVFGPGSMQYSVAAFTGLNAPQGVAVDAAGDIYAADSAHIYKLTPAGIQTTIASGSFTGVAVDPAGNVLGLTGLTLVEYPAGGGSALTLASSLVTPKAVALDGASDAFVADSGHGGYLEFDRNSGYFQFTYAPQSTTLNLTSSGTAAATALTYSQSDSTDFTLAPATTNGCSGALAAGTTCALTATFNPQSAGTVSDSVDFISSSDHYLTTILLTGTTVPLVPTLTLAVAPPTLAYGSTETLTSNVSGVKSTAGSVTFLNGATILATIATDNNGNAVYAYQPVVGSYTITATFAPTGSTTPTITSSSAKFTVTQATPSIGLKTSANSGYAGTTSFVLTATVASTTTGTPTKSVTFYAGTTSLGSVALTGNTAMLTTTSLPVGTDCVTAVYSGDTNFVAVTSTCASIIVSPGFGVTASSAALAFQQSYQEAQAYLTVNPGGSTSTLTFACQGLPAKISCAFSPSPLVLTGGSATSSVQMLVSNSSATASLGPRNASGFLAGHTIAVAALTPIAAIAALLFFGFRRRRLPMLIALVLLTLGASVGLSGCGSGPTALEQSSGSYNFTVTVSAGSTTLQTLNFTLTIPQS